MIAGEATMADESRLSSLRNNSENSRQNSRSVSAAPANGAVILVAAAGLLVLLGLMAQLGQLGLGPFTRDTFWIIPFLANGLWNILMALVSRSAFADAIPFWPLTLVVAGCTALFLLKPQSPAVVAKESSRRSDHGR